MFHVYTDTCEECQGEGILYAEGYGYAACPDCCGKGEIITVEEEKGANDAAA